MRTIFSWPAWAFGWDRRPVWLASWLVCWLVAGHGVLLTLAGCQATSGSDTEPDALEESSPSASDESSTGSAGSPDSKPDDPTPSETTGDASAKETTGKEAPSQSSSTDGTSSTDVNGSKKSSDEPSNEAAPANDKEVTAPTNDKDEETVSVKVDKHKDKGTKATSLEKAIRNGDWTAVQKQLDAVSKAKANRLYSRLLNHLGGVGPSKDSSLVGDDDSSHSATSTDFIPEDVVHLAKMAPKQLRTDHLTALGHLLEQILRRGFALPPFVKAWQAEGSQLGPSELEAKANLAWVLIEADHPAAASQFSPGLEDVLEEASPQLALTAVRAAYPREGNVSKDEKALKRLWALTRNWLKASEASSEPHSRTSTTRRLAIYLLPLLERSVTEEWLRDEFRERPDQAKALLDELSRLISRRRFSVDPSGKALLRLQAQAVRTLAQTIKPSPERQPSFNQAAKSWLQAASARLSGKLNPFEPPATGNGTRSVGRSWAESTQAGSLSVTSLIQSAPDKAWLSALPSSLKARTQSMLTRLSLASDRPSDALTHIAALTSYAPQAAGRLSGQLLEYRQAHPAPSINSSDQDALATMVNRMRSIQGLSVDERQVLRALMAEKQDKALFNTKRIKSLFGPFEARKPELLATIVRRLDTRLTDQWLRSKTVLSGSLPLELTSQSRDRIRQRYNLLNDLVTELINVRPESWRLRHASASAKTHRTLFNALDGNTRASAHNAYDPALKAFRTAAERYRQALSANPSIQANASSSLFLDWLQALAYQRDKETDTLQVSDTSAKLTDTGIATAFSSLPNAALQAHRDRLGNRLLDRIGLIPPRQRHRHLRQGAALLKGHPAVSDIQNRLNYYNSLLTGVRFNVTLRGDRSVGQDQAFGISLGLRHTTELARQTGHFLPFLRDPATGASAESKSAEEQHAVDRSRLEQQLRNRLKDRFDVRAFAFHSPDVQPRGFGKSGWRETPVAYLILQPKQASVDHIPALVMTIPFPDKPGIVVLPKRSSVQSLNVASKSKDVRSRPVSNLEVAQILDAREWEKTRELTLTVRASGHGLVPDLANLLDSTGDNRFNAEVQDSALRIRDLATQAPTIVPITERRWEIRLTPEAGAGQPNRYSFPKFHTEPESVDYKEWRNGRQIRVAPDRIVSGVPLVSRSYMPAFLVTMGLIIIGFAIWLLTKRGSLLWTGSRKHYRLPSPVTPYTVLTLLRQLESDPKVTFGKEERAELEQTIRLLEDHYFSSERQGEGNGVDLDYTARQWIQRFNNTGEH